MENQQRQLEKAEFEVTDLYELPERGAFVIGHIRNGVFRIGMRVANGPSRCYTISGIESIDNVSKQQHLTGLIFKERPDMKTLRGDFPIGSTLESASAKN